MDRVRENMLRPRTYDREEVETRNAEPRQVGNEGANCKRAKRAQPSHSEVRGLDHDTAYGIRTRVTGVRGQRPRPLDERGIR